MTSLSASLALVVANDVGRNSKSQQQIIGWSCHERGETIENDVYALARASLTVEMHSGLA